MRSTVPMRTAKIGCYIVSALQLVLGVILIAAPELSANVLCYLLGACLLVTSITRIIGYLSRDLYRLAFQFDLAFGILTAAIGLLLLLRPKAVINLVLLVCGILILTDGLFKIQIALDARGFGIRRWWLILIAAVAAGGLRPAADSEARRRDGHRDGAAGRRARARRAADLRGDAAAGEDHPASASRYD